MSETATMHLRAIGAVLTELGRYYTDFQGAPHQLNDTQVRAFVEGLKHFELPAIHAAAARHMATSKFFPRLSELLDHLAPKVDEEAAAHLAWTAVERALSSGGTYRGVIFTQGAIGETVRQVFGSWPSAGRFDTHGAEWAIRRKTFLAIFPGIARRHDGAPVTLRGLSPSDAPYVVPVVPGLPAPTSTPQLTETAPTHDEAVRLLKPFYDRLAETEGTRVRR